MYINDCTVIPAIPLSVGFIAIVAYNYGSKFDIIAPADGVYEENCNTGYALCHGVYFANRNNSQLDLAIALLKAGPPIEGARQHCGDHGSLAKYGISCSPSETLMTYI